jgi:hypothetical protein
MNRGLRAMVLGGWLAVGAVATGFAQTSDALKDRVGQLVAKLDADKPEARDAAEKSLIELGPRILPLLDDAGKNPSAERKTRLDKVRAALSAVAESNVGATKVTIKGQGIRLSEAIKILQSKTGNTISDVREETGADAPNPSLDLDIVDKTFFEALDIVAEKAGVTPAFFNGDGSVGLMAGPPAGAPPMAKPMVVYSGPFRIQFKQLGLVRDLSAATGTLNTQFDVAWEPRLRPMLMSLKGEGLDVTTDDGKKVTPSVMAEADEVNLSTGNPAAEVNLNFNAPDRSAKQLKSFKVKGEVTVPAGLKLFKFKSLEEKSVAVKDGDITVTMESTTVEEQSWRVTIQVAMPGGGPAMESYQQGLFNNRIWLQKADGSRFEHNGGLNNTGSDGGKLGFEYLFVDVPGKLSDYGLVYEAPSKVITIPLEFEYKNVSLP